jgi:hypothetical protein
VLKSGNKVLHQWRQLGKGKRSNLHILYPKIFLHLGISSVLAFNDTIDEQMVFMMLIAPPLSADT